MVPHPGGSPVLTKRVSGGTQDIISNGGGPCLSGDKNCDPIAARRSAVGARCPSRPCSSNEAPSYLGYRWEKLPWLHSPAENVANTPLVPAQVSGP